MIPIFFFEGYQVAVLGLGKTGITAAEALMRSGAEVWAWDDNEDARQRAREKDIPLVDLYQCNLAELTTLVLSPGIPHTFPAPHPVVTRFREAGLDQCDMALVAMGANLESSILASINLKLIGVPEVWAKATTRTHHRILSRLGVDRVIHPEVEMGQHIAQVLHNPLVRDYVSLGNGYHVVNFRIPESLEGQRLSDLPHGEKFNLRCIGVMRGTDFIAQDGSDCALQCDDLVLLLGKRDDLRSFAASL